MQNDPLLPATALRLGAGLVRVLAPNPGPLTGPGTNSYLLGHSRLAVIDPGPDDPKHLAALLAVIGSRPVACILITHPHLDHSGLAPALKAVTGAPVCGFGLPGAGRSATMARLAAAGMVGGGEGVHADFVPDRNLRDGALLTGPDGALLNGPDGPLPNGPDGPLPNGPDGALLHGPDGPMLHGPNGPMRVLHTPGHMSSHLAFGWGDALFVGDTVMGWASSIVSPPDGDMGQYMASLQRLSQSGAAVLYPGHGDPVTDPAARIAGLIAHRRAREAAILAALNGGPATPHAVTAAVYRDTPAALWPAADRNVLAHLIDLHERNRVLAAPSPGAAALFRLALDGNTFLPRPSGRPPHPLL